MIVNRYTLQGIADDLNAGAQIGIFVAPYNSISNVLHLITDYTDEEFTQVRAVQRKIYNSSGGSATLYTDALQIRGSSLDVLVVPHGSASHFIGNYVHGCELIEY